jgi:hypothetical protein
MPPSSRDAEPSARLQGKPSETTNQASVHFVTSEQAIHGPGSKAVSDLQWRAERKDLSTFSAPGFVQEIRSTDGMGGGRNHLPSLFTVLPRAAPARRRVRTTMDMGRANDAAAMDADQHATGLVTEKRAAGVQP